jgi:Ca2+-binding EF-hand superfamily protein
MLEYFVAHCHRLDKRSHPNSTRCTLLRVHQVLEKTAAERRATNLAELRAQQDAEQAAALAAIEAEEAARASATDVVAETFRKFDGDGGGTISRKELRGAMSSLGVELSKRGMKQLMKRFDEDDRQVLFMHLRAHVRANP